MKRYLGIGLFTFVVLIAGFLLGSGAIGDLLRMTETTIEAGAEKAEAESAAARAARITAENYAANLEGAERPIVEQRRSSAEGDCPVYGISEGMNCRALYRVWQRGFDAATAQLDMDGPVPPHFAAYKVEADDPLGFANFLYNCEKDIPVSQFHEAYYLYKNFAKDSEIFQTCNVVAAGLAMAYASEE